ncbi:hypothetical protein [Herpetosiphon giganteus]|uniref:hypothetical protein n=1 Tax=Herpetosiphon giganteus TaxID=2029754 RepID=UPI00195E0D39|nr:hypothetical protein [Herpetosiphon giganteus]MBM7846253.1 hypothetical protein [Herpetosiphon giganteus]
MPTNPPFTDWPPLIADRLELADSIVSLTQSRLAEWPATAPLAPYAAGDLLDLLREGMEVWEQVAVALEMVAAAFPPSGVIVLANPVFAQERVAATLQPAHWTDTLAPIVAHVLTMQPVTGDMGVTLREQATTLVSGLGAAAATLDGMVRDRWDSHQARQAEQALRDLKRLADDLTALIVPIPLAPVAPWPADWWTLAPDGPASLDAILAHARAMQTMLIQHMRLIQVARRSALRSSRIPQYQRVVIEGFDALRRVRVVQHVVAFVINRTLHECPVILPVPIEAGLAWAISGDDLAMLEAQRAVVLANPDDAGPWLALLGVLAEAIQHALDEYDAIDQTQLGLLTEGWEDVDAALGRLVHGAAAPPRPIMPWATERTAARAMQQTLLKHAAQVVSPKKPAKRRQLWRNDDITPEWRVCFDLTQEAIRQHHAPIIFRAGVLQQVAQLVQRQESPTPESLQERWVGRVWWAWNHHATAYLVAEAVHASMESPMYGVAHDQAPSPQSGSYQATAEALGEALRTASLAEERLWRLGIDPRPWVAAATQVYAAVDAANPHTPATVCCDCGKPFTEPWSSIQCKSCDKRDWLSDARAFREEWGGVQPSTINEE